MNREHAMLIQEALEYQGWESDVVDDYSGRCMYGKTTHAVETEAPLIEVLTACLSHAIENPEAWEPHGTPSMKTDQLGLGIVIY